MLPRFLLALLLGALALTLAACGGGEEVSPVPEAVETVATTTGETETDGGGTETEGGETETEGGETETDGGETETDGETNPGVTDPGDTETGDGGAPAAGNAAAGEAVWNEGGCGGCHVLDAAGSEGQIGPNLDEAEPAFELVVERVTNGMGAMPAFKGDLSEEQIQNVAAYVVESTGGG